MFVMLELMKEILAFCIENNCSFDYEPISSSVSVHVRGLLSAYKNVSVDFQDIDEYGFAQVELFVREEDDEYQYIELPYRDAITCLEDVVAKYQL